MSRRHQGRRRRAYNTRQHELRERRGRRTSGRDDEFPFEQEFDQPLFHPEPVPDDARRSVGR